MTYKQALENGYKNADIKLESGYVSRKVNPENQVVKIAGGKRKGQLYVLLANYQSNRFCYRQYLSKED